MQWKIPDMCVRGCRIVWFDLIFRMSIVWRWEPFDARWTCILWASASFCVGFFAYDTCMIMVIRLPCIYLCIFSAVQIVYILLRCQSLCTFGRVRWMRLSGVSYSLFDPMVWELPLTMVSIGAHWIWTGVEREKLVFSMLEISELMSSTPTCPWWLDRHVPANTWCCFCVGTHAIPLGGTAAGGQRNVGITTIPCRTLP